MTKSRQQNSSTLSRNAQRLCTREILGRFSALKTSTGYPASAGSPPDHWENKSRLSLRLSHQVGSAASSGDLSEGELSRKQWLHKWPQDSRLLQQQGHRLLATIGRRSATAGAIGAAATIETGVTAEEQIGANNRIDPGVAMTAGAIKGSLEAIVPAAIGMRLGLTKDLSNGLIHKMVDDV